MNLGLLGGKQECFLCAMQHPGRLRLEHEGCLIYKKTTDMRIIDVNLFGSKIHLVDSECVDNLFLVNRRWRFFLKKKLLINRFSSFQLSLTQVF